MSCGCRVSDFDEGAMIAYADETCDAVDGFIPCVVHAFMCHKCIDRIKASGVRIIGSEAEEAAFFAEHQT